MSPEIAALIGVAIGSFGTLAVTWITTRAEERKHYRSLIYQAGVENFKQACEMARHQKGAIMPLDDFIINMAKLGYLLSRKENFSAEELEQMLQETDKIRSKLYEFRQRTQLKDGRS